MGNCLYQNCSVRLDYPSGVDGRGGNQPRYTAVVGNLVREVGLYQKQSGHWAQHLTARTTLTGNVFFNGPHASINFNDGAKKARFPFDSFHATRPDNAAVARGSSTLTFCLAQALAAATRWWAA